MLVAKEEDLLLKTLKHSEVWNQGTEGEVKEGEEEEEEFLDKPITSYTTPCKHLAPKDMTCSSVNTLRGHRIG